MSLLRVILVLSINMCVVFISVGCASVKVSHQQQLQNKCGALNGSLVSSLACPTSKQHREGLFCILPARATSSSNSTLISKSVKQTADIVFFNGCTAGVADYDAVFFDACYTHDMCYHHEPATNRKSKSQCDRTFYEDMKLKCANRDDKKRCLVMAKLFYESVEHFGEKSWQCSDTVNLEFIRD